MGRVDKIWECFLATSSLCLPKKKKLETRAVSRFFVAMGKKKQQKTSTKDEDQLTELLGMFEGLLAPGVGPCVVVTVFASLILLFVLTIG